jgi:hypothetical protein
MHKLSTESIEEIKGFTGIKQNDVKSIKEEELLKKVLTKMVDQKVELYLTDDEMNKITEGKKESASENMAGKTHGNSNGQSQKHEEKKDVSNVPPPASPPAPLNHSNLKKGINQSVFLFAYYNGGLRMPLFDGTSPCLFRLTVKLT